MQTDVVVIQCPACGGEVDTIVRHNGFQSGATSIGPPFLSCPSCSTPVGTGKTEWKQMHILGKAWYLLSRTLWLVVSAVFVGGALAAVLRMFALEWNWINPAQQTVFAIAAFGAVASLIGLLLVRNTLVEIRDSLRRTTLEND